MSHEFLLEPNPRHSKSIEVNPGKVFQIRHDLSQTHILTLKDLRKNQIIDTTSLKIIGAPDVFAHINIVKPIDLMDDDEPPVEIPLGPINGHIIYGARGPQVDIRTFPVSYRMYFDCPTQEEAESVVAELWIKDSYFKGEKSYEQYTNRQGDPRYEVNVYNWRKIEKIGDAVKVGPSSTLMLPPSEQLLNTQVFMCVGMKTDTFGDVWKDFIEGLDMRGI